jgi:hypothetical protein
MWVRLPPRAPLFDQRTTPTPKPSQVIALREIPADILDSKGSYMHSSIA